MVKFEITVHRTDAFEIEVDENIIDDKWIKHFESYMWDVDEDCPCEDLAIHIAQMRARFGPCFVEGFGYIPVEGEYLTDKQKEHLAHGFRMKVISEDNDIQCDAKIIK